VLANDTDIDACPKTVASVSDPAHGTTVFTGGGTGITYTPDPNSNGVDTFTYTLNGGSTATVTVTGVEDGPIAPDMTFNSLIGRPNNIDLLTIASDPDGDPLRVKSLTIIFPPSYTDTINRCEVPGCGGSVTINTPGSQVVIDNWSRLTTFTYRGVVGVGTIDYVVSDGKAERTGTLTFNSNPPPV
jgi:hypothetical protein